MADNKKKRMLTPVGFAKWAHVHTPQQPFTDAKGRTKGDPKYQIDVCFSIEDPAWRAWASDLKAAVIAVPVQMDPNTDTPMPKQMPIKRELDKDDKPTGRYVVSFKTGEKFPPGVFDRFGRVIPKDTLVGNESRVRVAYLPSEYTAFGGGVALYLNAVQVIELVEYKSQTAAGYGFEVESAPAADPNGMEPWADQF